jgi:hypothetical protein
MKVSIPMFVLSEVGQLVKFIRESENKFVAASGHVMEREYGLTPNNNPLGGRWVLRSSTGEFIDFDRYSSDLAERRGFTIDYMPKEFK